MGPELFGIVVCRSVGAVPDILGSVWRSFRPKSGSESKISGRILNISRGLFSSAESGSGRRVADLVSDLTAELEIVFRTPGSLQGSPIGILVYRIFRFGAALW
jgi:hypothetical protein